MKISTVILFLFFIRMNLPACTSFSCYSEETWYGMNFDYPNNEMCFRMIAESDTVSIFEMGFMDNGNFCSVYGYNSYGNFSNCQMLYPEATNFITPGEDEITTFDAWYYYTRYFENSTYFQDYLENGGINANGILVRQAPPITIHSMMADAEGYSFVLEAVDEDNYITPLENDFLVMANFPNYQFAGQPYTSVSGVGANRYIASYENIMNNFDDFDYNDAWNTLEVSLQNSGSFRTRCSTIFNPATNELYIALHRDLYHIWRVRFEDQILETYSGFSEYSSFNLDQNGVSSYEMAELVDTEDVLFSIESSKIINYPNPFNPSTTISFETTNLNELSRIEIYNIKGQKIKTFPINSSTDQPINSVIWNGTDQHDKPVSSGIYYYVLKQRGKILKTRKMILMK
jgi:hypothetical protein